MFQNGGKATSKSDPCTMSKVSKITQFSGFSAPFLGPPFGKRPPKITEGGPFDHQWPISRINPAMTFFAPEMETKYLEIVIACINK